MIATASQKVNSGKKTPKKITWERFLKTYLSREDSFKYEWVEGEVVKTNRSMFKEQQRIWLNLLLFLDQLRVSSTSPLGYLFAEMDAFFGKNHRRPDITYLEVQQVKVMHEAEIRPNFVIEIISNNDQAYAIQDKMLDYLEAGIPIVWHIYPKQQIVHIYRGNRVEICRGADICSAKPVIPGFLIATEDIFKVG